MNERLVIKGLLEIGKELYRCEEVLNRILNVDHTKLTSGNGIEGVIDLIIGQCDKEWLMKMCYEYYHGTTSLEDVVTHFVDVFELNNELK